MGLFHHESDEPVSAEFMGLVLDETGLQTPSGFMPMGAITRAEFVRNIVPDGTGPEETSVPAVAGGAVAGGVLFGPVGAVAGGALGSTVKEEGPQKHRTQSVQLVFETSDLTYSVDIPREQETAASEFADAVKHAMKRHAG